MPSKYKANIAIQRMSIIWWARFVRRAGMSGFLIVLLLAALTHGRQLYADIDDLSDSEEHGENSHHCEPQMVHLALSDKATEMRITWTTPVSGCDSKLHYRRMDPARDSAAKAARNLWPFDYIAEFVDSDSIEPSDFCGSPASQDSFEPLNIHSAVLTDLDPDEWYEYQVGHHEPVRRFKSALQPGPDARFMFVAYGDMGESVHSDAKSPGASMTADRVRSEVLDAGAELIVHVGDISYADGEQRIWDTFLDQVEPYASRVPYQIAVGNHEYDWQTGLERQQDRHTWDASGNDEPYQPDWGNFGNDSGGECGVTVARLFPMPGSGLGKAASSLPASENHRHNANSPFWYSFDYGSVHFTTLSTEHDLTSGSEQRKWLVRDLRAVDRCRTPWLVLLTHRPMYVPYPHKSNRIVGEHLRESLESLLEEFEVDMVLSGHVHAYARTCNVYRERCISNADGGTTHVTLGCGGRKLSDVEHTQPGWLEYAESEWGYGRVTVHGSRHLTFEYVRSDSGRVRDAFTLTTSHAAMRSCDALMDHGLPSDGDNVLRPEHLDSAARAAEVAVKADSSFAGDLADMPSLLSSRFHSMMSSLCAQLGASFASADRRWRSMSSAFHLIYMARSLG